jgi:hypothetical protein
MAESGDKGRGAGFWVLVGCGGLVLVAILFCVGSSLIPLIPGVLDPAGSYGYEPPSPPPDQGYGATGPVLPPAAGPIVPAPPPPGSEEDIPAPPPITRVVEFEVTSVSAGGPLARGARCRFPVDRLPRPDGTYHCQARVECDGQLLYGGQENGFFECTMPDEPAGRLVGEDYGTTASDTDAAFAVDSDSQTLTIRDDDQGAHGTFSLEGRVLVVE